MRRSLIDTLLSNFLSSNSPKKLACDTPDGESRFSLVEHGRRNRELAETYIAKQKAKVSSTRVIAFTPRLFTLRHGGGVVCGSFGLRSAQGRLLVEQFLVQPIEYYIGSLLVSKIARQTIIEADHLFVSVPASINALLKTLIDRVRREAIQWLVLLGTAELLEELRRIGLSVSAIDFPAPENSRIKQRMAMEYAGTWPFIVLVNVDGSFESNCSFLRRGSPP